jgi:hypothetical protein
MKGLTSKEHLFLRVISVVISASFVGCVSAVIVYAGHGWTWPSEINGVELNLPEFVAVVVLLTFVVGVCIDYWRMKQRVT